MKFFLSGLCLLFIGLKLTNHIAWSWWWIMSPLWIPPAISVVSIGLLALCSQTFRTSFVKEVKRNQAKRKWERLKKALQFKDFEV